MGARKLLNIGHIASLSSNLDLVNFPVLIRTETKPRLRCGFNRANDNPLLIQPWLVVVTKSQ